MKIYIKITPSASFETIDVIDAPLGKGGQGTVHNILTPKYADYCLKIYKEKLAAANAYDRIAFMVQNPPKNIMSSPSFRICWPVALAYDTSKNFVGYVMPLAFPKSRDLLILSTYSAKPISAQRKYASFPEWFNKYELTSSTGVRNRIKMLHNWAIAMFCIHETGKYVLIDLKPENVMATASGKISVVDTDSFQIAQNGRILFPATACTPGYYAPEFLKLKNNGQAFPESCDRFAAAVCFYKILTGTHPYSGTVLKAPYDKCETEQECIDNGLFAFGSKSNYISFCTGFNPHANFKNLPATIQNLFKRAFGNRPEERPSMEEWGKVLHEAAGDSVQITGSKIKPAKTNSIPIKITSVKFCATDKAGNTVLQEGVQLHNQIEYLNPVIYYDVINPGADLTLWYKIISPSGQFQQGNNAPNGFSWKTIVSRSSTGSSKVKSGGFGNPQKTCYNETGNWTVEFYHGDTCIYRASAAISQKSAPRVVPPKPTYQPSKPTYQPKVSTSKTDKNRNKWKWIVGIAATLVVGVLAWIFMLAPMMKYSSAPKYYVISNYLQMKDSNNKISNLGYGQKVAMYEDLGSTILGEADGTSGYVSSSNLVPQRDFELLNAVWGNDDVLNVVDLTRYRKAVLDFVKRNGYTTGPNGYQLIMPSAAEYPNTVMKSHEVNNYDKFRDFAFILSNKNTGNAKLAIYSFDSSGEPVFVHSESCSPDKMITNISYSVYKKTWNVYYAKRAESYSERAKKTKAVVEVSDIQFANVNYNNSIIDNYGSTLYDDIKYLKPKIHYRGLNNRNSATINVKIYRPDGTLDRSKTSPSGYTNKTSLQRIDKGSFYTSELLGWGNNEGNCYAPGEYIVEIWNNGVKVASKSVIIHSKKSSDGEMLSYASPESPKLIDDDVKKNPEPVVKSVKKDDIAHNDPDGGEEIAVAKVVEAPANPVQEAKKIEDNNVYTAVEEMPQFPGGESALNKYLSNNIKYPQIAMENGVQGRVIVQFVVTKNGSVGDVKVIRSVDSYLDKEAIRVCKSLPNFIPGKLNGQTVNVWYTLPITFKLQQ